MIYDVIRTANPFPYTAKFMCSRKYNNSWLARPTRNGIAVLFIVPHNSQTLLTELETIKLNKSDVER